MSVSQCTEREERHRRDEMGGAACRHQRICSTHSANAPAAAAADEGAAGTSEEAPGLLVGRHVLGGGRQQPAGRQQQQPWELRTASQPRSRCIPIGVRSSGDHFRNTSPRHTNAGTLPHNATHTCTTPHHPPERLHAPRKRRLHVRPQLLWAAHVESVEVGLAVGAGAHGCRVWSGAGLRVRAESRRAHAGCMAAPRGGRCPAQRGARAPATARHRRHKWVLTCHGVRVAVGFVGRGAQRGGALHSTRRADSRLSGSGAPRACCTAWPCDAWAGRTCSWRLPCFPSCPLPCCPSGPAALRPQLPRVPSCPAALLPSTHLPLRPQHPPATRARTQSRAARRAPPCAQPPRCSGSRAGPW